MSDPGRTPYRRKGAVPLAEMLAEVMAPACRKRGFTTVDLVAHWPDIVGRTYGATTQPEKLAWPRTHKGVEPDMAAGATLTLRCVGAAALRLQHDLPQVIERINMFFGWRAVERVRIVQMPLVRRERKARPRPGPVSAEAEARVEAACSGIADDGLREALARLGRAVAGGG